MPSEAPWAVDANGNAVPTTYSVSGDTITQTTDLTGVTAFPVVVDPEVTYGQVIYVYFDTTEVAIAAFVAAP